MQLFYHKEDYDNALVFALESGICLDITRRDQYVDKIIAKALDKYSVIMCHNHTAKEEDKLELEKNLEDLVNAIFEDTIKNAHDFKLIVGIAIETRRLDIVLSV
jgi:hypothetical protein